MSEPTLSDHESQFPAGENREKEVVEEAQPYVAPPTSIIPPDGGKDAWLTIAGAWMVMFCTFGYINAFGVFQDYYTRGFLSHKTASDISWIGSFQLYLQYAPGVFVGRAFDAGYFHHLNAAGSVIYVFGIFMLSLVKPGQFYQVFLSQGVCMGLGQGILFLPALSIVNHHFRRLRALAVGIVVTGASAGGIIFPIFTNQLIYKIGFANTVRATGGFIAGLLIIANLIMRTRLPPKNKRPPLPPPDMKAILTDAPYLWSIAAAFVISLGLFFPYFYLQLYSIEIGIKPDLAFYSLTIVNAGSVVGRLLPTFLADRVGVYNMLVPCIYISGVLVFAILGVHNFGGVVVIGLLYGCTSGAYASLIPSLLAQLASHMGEIGIRMGMAFTVVAFGQLCGTPIDGALLGKHFTWWKPIILSGICLVAGGVMMTFSRFLYVKRKGGVQFV